MASETNHSKIPHQNSMFESATTAVGGMLSARTPVLQQNMVTMVNNRSTVANEKSTGAANKKLKKNIIKQRAGKNTVAASGKKQSSGFTSTATLKTRNHFESISPKREFVLDSQGGPGANILGSV